MTWKMRMQATGLILTALLAGPVAGALVVGTGHFLAWLAGAEVVPMGLLVPLAWLGAALGWVGAWHGVSWLVKAAMKVHSGGSR